MKAENENFLFNTYPILYHGKDLPITENLMGFGFECGDGWFQIIDNLSKALETLNKLGTIKIQATQVKEKYGTLRFYYIIFFDDKYTKEEINSFNVLINNLVEEAETLSETTCEECGNTGKLRYDIGWIRCLCKKHYKLEKRK